MLMTWDALAKDGLDLKDRAAVRAAAALMNCSARTVAKQVRFVHERIAADPREQDRLASQQAGEATGWDIKFRASVKIYTFVHRVRMAA